MTLSSRARRVLIGLIVVGVLIVPPLLWFGGVVVWAAGNWDGNCPGIMDIPTYACSRWEYIGRNTVSPFAFAAHLGITLVWVLGSGTLMGVTGLIWWLLSRRPRSNGSP